ncbi:MAG: IS66 family transposase zinc-finger binding domain-containing protein [Aliidongia sp.]
MTEVLDYVSGRFQVIRHVRPKYACKACDVITPGPGSGHADAARPGDTGAARASPGLEVL